MINNSNMKFASDVSDQFADNLNAATTWTSQFGEILSAINEAQLFARSGGCGMLITGQSGAGKTRLCETLKKLEKFKPIQKEECLTQPILYIESPDKASDTALLVRLLSGLEANLPKSLDYWDKMERLVRLIEEKGVKLIIIDEAHDYLPKGKLRPGSVPKSLNIIKKLINRLKIPLILVGLPELLKINLYMFNTHEEIELPQRFPIICNIGLITYGIEKNEKQEFAGILDNYTKKLPVQPKLLKFLDGNVAINTDLLDRFYITTKGDFRLLKQLILEVFIYMQKGNELTRADLHYIRNKRAINNQHNIDAFSIPNKIKMKRLTDLLKENQTK